MYEPKTPLWFTQQQEQHRRAADADLATQLDRRSRFKQRWIEIAGKVGYAIGVIVAVLVLAAFGLVAVLALLLRGGKR